MITVNFEGMTEVLAAFTRLGKVPQKHVTTVVKSAMGIVKTEARRRAPFETGALRRGIILVGERSKVKGRKVYRIVFDRKMNDVFQKFNASGEQNAYYPASQEYGWKLRSGGNVPAKRFIKGSMEDNWVKVENTIIGKLRRKMRAELAKAGIK